jgi:hypothetical protein
VLGASSRSRGEDHGDEEAFQEACEEGVELPVPQGDDHERQGVLPKAQGRQEGQARRPQEVLTDGEASQQEAPRAFVQGLHVPEGRDDGEERRVLPQGRKRPRQVRSADVLPHALR